MSNTKEPVRLRKRQMPSGNTSLYLDIYWKGQRDYEYLHLYLKPERNRVDKEANRETLRLADAIRSKRVIELRNGEYDFKNDFAAETLFFKYFEYLINKKDVNPESNSNRNNWGACLNHLRHYEAREDIRLSDITSRWIEGFKTYLEALGGEKKKHSNNGNKSLSKNTRALYFSKLRTCINHAYEEGLIPTNPLRGVECIKPEESTRMYLTIEEVQLLAQTECRVSEIKKAFLFSCLTGLRRSDITKLTWKDVHQQGDFTRIIFKQKKTGGQEYLDIARQAAQLMGERGGGGGGELVFGNIHTPVITNRVLRDWVRTAGIDKDITFHSGRHTFATMMLDIGTDIYTVSKLLGHREISTTQIYAKIMDKNKQAAVASIPDIFNKKNGG